MQQRRFIIRTFMIATVFVAVLLFGACAETEEPTPAPRSCPNTHSCPSPGRRTHDGTYPSPRGYSRSQPGCRPNSPTSRRRSANLWWKGPDRHPGIRIL